MGILKKGTKLFGIWNYKCPRCHEGDLFKVPFDFGTAFKMPDKCPNCAQTYMPEPGFYYGAMFISYIMTGFFCLGFVGLLILGFDFSINGAFIILMIVMALLFVTVFRISRSIWINLMVKYNPQFSKKEKQIQR